MTSMVADRLAERVQPVLVKRKPRPTLDVVTFNVFAGQEGKQLRDNLAELAHASGRPAVLALQEAYGLHDPIPGYRRVAAARIGEREALSCQLLVRSDVRVVERFVLDVGGPWWVGPHQGIKHPPRTFVGATVEHQGQRWDVLDVHRVPGGFARNREAYAAEDRAIVRWEASRPPARPKALPGDWQHPPADDRPLAPRGLAKRLGGRVAMRGIDGVIFTRSRRTVVRELVRLFGSDSHRPVYVRLEAWHHGR